MTCHLWHCYYLLSSLLPNLQVNGMQLADKVVYVGPFLKRMERGGNDSKFTNVYVKNLSEDTDDAALMKLAEEYGECISAVIMRVSGRHHSGCCVSWFKGAACRRNCRLFCCCFCAFLLHLN